MKLTKISLATIVALGAFSSIASATPLEEAIKNVDLSGYARYRYDVKTVKNDGGTKNNRNFAGATANYNDYSRARHRFTSVATFKAALDDNFFGVLSLRYNSFDGSGKTTAGTTSGKEDQTDTRSTFDVAQIYIGYKVGNTTVTAGRQTIGSYFTDDAIGTGLKVLNNDIQGLTLTAAAFDGLESGNKNGWGIDNELLEGYLNDKSANLYNVGAIGSYDPVSFQLWYSALVDYANFIAADLGVSFDLSQDVKIGAQAQYGHSDVDNKLRNRSQNNINDVNFYTLQLSSEFFGADASLGYVGWKVKDFKKGFVTLDDQGKFNDAGEEAFDYTNLRDRGNFLYGTLGYSFNDFRVGGDIVTGKIKDENGDKTKINEYVARADYKYSKKLKFATWYSYKTEKEENWDNREKEKTFRFEAKYSF
jgi:hydrogenase-4 component I